MESKETIFDAPILRQESSKERQKRDTFERRIDVSNNYIKKYGFANARVFIKQLAEKYQVNQRQIYKDFEWAKGNVKPSNLREIKIDLGNLRDKAISLAFTNINTAASQQERNEAIKTAWVVIEKYRQDLEEWGEKPKVAEKHEIFNKSISLEIIRHDGRDTENKNSDGIEQEAIGSMGYPSG